VTPEGGEYFELSTDPAERELPLVAWAEATHTNGSIARVSFYDQEQLLGSTTAGISNIFTFIWRTPPAGEHLISAIALDSVGQENLSAPAYIQIAGNEDNLPPHAAITNLAPDEIHHR